MELLKADSPAKVVLHLAKIVLIPLLHVLAVTVLPFCTTIHAIRHAPVALIQTLMYVKIV